MQVIASRLNGNAGIFNQVQEHIRCTYDDLSEGQVREAVTSLASAARGAHAPAIQAAAAEEGTLLSQELLPAQLRSAVDAHVRRLYGSRPRRAAYDSGGDDADDDEIPYQRPPGRAI